MDQKTAPMRPADRVAECRQFAAPKSSTLSTVAEGGSIERISGREEAPRIRIELLLIAFMTLAAVVMVFRNNAEVFVMLAGPAAASVASPALCQLCKSNSDCSVASVTLATPLAELQCQNWQCVPLHMDKDVQTFCAEVLDVETQLSHGRRRARKLLQDVQDDVRETISEALANQRALKQRRHLVGRTAHGGAQSKFERYFRKRSLREQGRTDQEKVASSGARGLSSETTLRAAIDVDIPSAHNYLGAFIKDNEDLPAWLRPNNDD